MSSKARLCADVLHRDGPGKPEKIYIKQCIIVITTAIKSTKQPVR